MDNEEFSTDGGSVDDPLGDVEDDIPSVDDAEVPVYEDPEAVRAISILPPEDDDEAYCARHERDMESVELHVKHQNKLWQIAEGYTLFTCPLCLGGMAKYMGDQTGEDISPRDYLRTAMFQNQELVENYLVPMEGGGESN